jgi:hypothetical protein
VDGALTVGRNLGPFFEAWGVPTSPEARQSLADLPAWMPEPGFPERYRNRIVYLPMVRVP